MSVEEFCTRVLRLLEEFGHLQAGEERIWGKRQQDDLEGVPEVGDTHPRYCKKYIALQQDWCLGF